MALPTLDATFASSVDLPRKQMLAKWLVEELGETQAPSSVLVSGLDDYYCTDPNGTYTYFDISNGKPRYQKPNRDDPVVTTDDIYWNGSQWEINVCGGDLLYFSTEDVAYPWLVASWEVVNGSGSLAVTEVSTQSPLSNYYSLPERYLWAKIAVAAGGPKTEADYISLPKNYAWSDIYNAVAFPTFPSAGLLAFWKLSNLTDASGNGNTLTNNNGVTFVAGKIGNAASLSKVNGSYLTSNVVFNTTGVDFSVAAWVNIQANTGNTVFLGTATGGAWGFNVTPSNTLTFNNAAEANLTVTGFVRNVWTHVAATNDNDGMVSLYVNGVMVASGIWDGYANSPDVRLQSAFSDQQGNLLMDAVGLWNRTLTSAEIAKLYNKGRGLEP